MMPMKKQQGILANRERWMEIDRELKQIKKQNEEKIARRRH